MNAEKEAENYKELGTWSVELTRSNGEKFTRGCEWFEGIPGYEYKNTYNDCRKWGNTKGKNGKTANEVCCYCRFGTKIHVSDDDY